MIGVHAVGILWSFLTALALHEIFAIVGKRAEARLAAVFYTIFSTTYFPKYVATSINSVMVLFLVLSVILVIEAEKNRSLWRDALAGVILGIAFLFKYQAGIQCVVFFLFTLPWWVFRRHGFFWEYGWGKWLIRNMVFAVGFLVPFVLQGLVLWRLGVWQDFYEWSILGSARYVETGGETISFWLSFFPRFGSFVLATLVLWYGVWRSLMQRTWEAVDGFYFLLWLLFLFTLIPVCLGGRFYAHYFVQLTPWLSALAAVALYPQLLSMAKIKFWVMTFCLLSVSVFWLMRVNSEWFYKITGDDDLALQRQVGEKIRFITKPEDKIFIWGFADVIHFYSERRSASRFLWSDWLTGRVPGPVSGRFQEGASQTLVSGMAWQKLFEDFGRNPPDIFVDTSSANIHQYGRYPLSHYAQLKQYVVQNFPNRFEINGVTVYLRRLP